MLKDDYKEATLQKIEEMSAKDFILAFVRIGSNRSLNSGNLEKIIEMDLKNCLTDTSSCDIIYSRGEDNEALS